MTLISKGFAMKLFSGLFLFLTALFNLNCNAQQEPDAVITTTELKERMDKKDQSMVILDVRNAEELTGPLGRVPGDIIHIPLSQLEQRVSELDQFKGKEIAVVCRSGNRSSIATNILRAKGFNAKNMTGGMIEYNRK